MASKAPKDGESKSTGLLKRGNYHFNALGTAVFVGLRALDPLLQYQILARGWGTSVLARLGFASIPGTLDLSAPRMILLAMAVGSTSKHVFWATYINNENLLPSIALMVCGFNTFVNSMNSMLLLSATASSALAVPQITVPGTNVSLSAPTVVGIALYVVGIALETISEVQRKSFKSAPENKGKICTTGLWGMARHINYGGYTLWRVGYCLAAGGWVGGLVMGVQMCFNFLGNSIPEMDGYMTDRYGEQWKRYKTDVPSRLLPGIV